MKIADLIKELKEIEKKEGNVEVLVQYVGDNFEVNLEVAHYNDGVVVEITHQ